MPNQVFLSASILRQMEYKYYVSKKYKLGYITEGAARFIHPHDGEFVGLFLYSH